MNQLASTSNVSQAVNDEVATASLHPQNFVSPADVEATKEVGFPNRTGDELLVSKEIGFPATSVVLMSDDSDVDEVLLLMLAITDNPLFLHITTQDDVGIELWKNASDDHLTKTDPKQKSSLISWEVMTKDLMDFGAHMHYLMAELFPRKHGQPPKSIYPQK